MSQIRYAIELLTQACLQDSNPCQTPMAVSPKLSKSSGSPCSTPTEYRQLIDALQYLTITRPNISYSINLLTQFMHQPRRPHFDAPIRVL